MSNFLPFITVNSSEEAMFSALLQRTKGFSNTSVSVLLSMLLSIGIEAMRNTVSNMPSNMTISSKLKEIVNSNPQYNIPITEKIFWANAMKYILVDDEMSFGTLPIKYSELLFTSIAVYTPKSVNVDIEAYKKYSKADFNIDVASIGSLCISATNSERVGFSCWEAFKAYVAYTSYSDHIVSILPVYISTHKGMPSKEDYKSNHCSAPAIRS